MDRNAWNPITEEWEKTATGGRVVGVGLQRLLRPGRRKGGPGLKGQNPNKKLRWES